MSVKCQVNVKSQSELDIGGRETCCSVFCSTQSRMNLGEGNFSYKEGVLTCEGVDISRLGDNLAVENLTPCYVYSRYISFLKFLFCFYGSRL